MFQISTVVSSGDALPDAERRMLDDLLHELDFSTPAEAEQTRRLMTRLYSMQHCFAPAVPYLLARVKKAVFWHDCRRVKTLVCTEQQEIAHPQWLSVDLIGLEGLGVLHAIPEAFWGALNCVAASLLFQRISLRLNNAMTPLLHSSLLRISLESMLACLGFALASHHDPVLLERGERFDAFFQLFFEGNLVVGYDDLRHEALILVVA